MTTNLKPLIDELKDTMRRYMILRFDEEDSGELGEPCTAAQLDQAERDLGQPLPPSYRAFLELHNGWTDFEGEASLLSVEDRHAPWYPRRVKGIREHLKSFNIPDFLEHGFLILVHPDVSTVLYLDKSKPTGNGELEVVEHSLRETELGRYPNFEACLRHTLDVYQKMAEEQKR